MNIVDMSLVTIYRMPESITWTLKDTEREEHPSLVKFRQKFYNDLIKKVTFPSLFRF